MALVVDAGEVEKVTREEKLGLRCRLGIHHFVDFPDPNPETGGLESQGYQACTHCPKERDAKLYYPAYHYRSGNRG